jgi:hypothetical protein
MKKVTNREKNRRSVGSSDLRTKVTPDKYGQGAKRTKMKTVTHSFHANLTPVIEEAVDEYDALHEKSIDFTDVSLVDNDVSRIDFTDVSLVDNDVSRIDFTDVSLVDNDVSRIDFTDVSLLDDALRKKSSDLKDKVSANSGILPNKNKEKHNKKGNVLGRQKREASKEDKKRRTNKPGKANTQPGEDNTQPGEDNTQQPMGGKDSGKRSGLPIGVANGRSLESELHINTSNESETVLVLPRPTMLKGDGFSYLRASPLHAKIRLGNANGEITNALTDVDSNVGLIDLELLRASYPDVRINESHSATVKGVGKTKAMGFVVVPVWVDVLAPPDGTGYRKPIKVQTDIEFHVVKDYTAKVLLGLDYILDYSCKLSVHLSEL